MALEQKLSLKLSQKLVMTPSLQQAIKLLQMTHLELEGVLAKEMVENPVLEELEPSSIDEDAGAAATTEEKAEKDADSLTDIDLDAYFGDYAESWEGRTTASVYEEREGPPLENTLSQEDDLYDHLLWQLHMLDLPALTREVAELVIGNLDSEGFLVATIDEICIMGVQRAEIEGGQSGEEAAASDLAGVVAEIQGVDETRGGGAVGVPDVQDPSIPETPEFSTAEAASGAAAELDAPVDVGLEGVSGEAQNSTGAASAEAAEAASESAEDPEAVEEVEPELPGGSYPRELVREALAIVRGLEPAGVACYDLHESLLTQLDQLDEPEDSLTRRLVAEKWELFTKRKFEQIARDFGIPLEELKPVVESIARLETRPGRRFNTDHTQYVQPDVHIVKVGEEYVVQLNDNGLPRLRVSKSYRKMLKNLNSDDKQSDAQDYIKEKMRSALWLIKSLDQRQRTIYKVANSIIKQQRAFFDHGVEHLRPMVLRDVAEDIEMHESTVSRVVSNKYMHTPRGLLPMKFFFHSGIDRDYGGDISSLSVKRKIKHMIQGEDPKKPLSDSELMRVLKREGIQIARRTVAKYRDELGIPSSTERKQIF
ncbi:MAG: RNA polymerase factor sigma-54 [Acidobacteriota bacterium]